jgi:hypothetical protein
MMEKLAFEWIGKTGMVVSAYNCNTQKAEAGESQVPD